MRDYGSIAPSYWTRGTGKKLRGDKDARILATWLMTGPPVEVTGLYHASLATMADETGLSIDEVRAALDRLAGEQLDHFCEYDEADELVWIPNLAREQLAATLDEAAPERAAVMRALVPFRRHRFFAAFMARYGAAYALIPKPLVLTPPEPKPAGKGPKRATAAPKEPKEPKATRGTRITEDWTPADATVDTLHKQGVDALACVPEFIDYWLGVPGQRGIRCDWEATFRNSVRRLIANGTAPPWRPPPPASGTVAVAQPDHVDHVDFFADPRWAAFVERLGHG